MASREIPIDLSKMANQMVANLPRPNIEKKEEVKAPEVQKTENIETPKEEKKEEKHDAKQCKYCKWFLDVDPEEPTKEQLREFARCIALGDPYKTTIRLFGGAVTITFRDLTADEEEFVRSKVAAEVAAGEVKDQWALQDRMTSLRMGFGVINITTSKNVYTPPEVEELAKCDLNERFIELRKACVSQAVYNTIRWHYVKFNASLGTMQARAADPSFFEATA